MGSGTGAAHSGMGSGLGLGLGLGPVAARTGRRLTVARAPPLGAWTSDARSCGGNGTNVTTGTDSVEARFMRGLPFQRVA
jgi:hypothetical protein